MKRFTNIALQVVGFATQLITMFGGLIPEKYRPAVVAGVATAQGVVGVIAHNFNPDGTAATEPYVK